MIDTDEDLQPGVPEDPEDAAIRAVLSGTRLRTNEQHDQRVLDAARAAADRSAAAVGPVAWWRRGAPLAAAAVVALAFAVVLVVPDPQPDVLRSSGPVSALQPAHQAVLEAPPTMLSWAAVPGARGYRVTLMDEAAVVLQRQETEQPAATVDIELARGRSYLWSIEVLGEAQPPERGPFWFRIEE